MNQEFYTKLFLKQTNQTMTPENINLARHRWWFNPRTKKTGALRLSDEGLKFLKEELNLSVYEIPFPIVLDLKPQVIIHLDRFMDCPYHLTEKSIVVTNEKKCFELHLFSGDVQKYGLIKAMSRQNKSNDSGKE